MKENIASESKIKKGLTAQVFFSAFQNLPRTEKDHFLSILAMDKKIMEDLMDLSLIAKRKKEPSRPFRQILKELNK